MNSSDSIVIAAGALCLAGAYFNWDWFMNHRKARLLVRVLGRNGARVLYGVLGATLLLTGFLSLVGTIDPTL